MLVAALESGLLGKLESCAHFARAVFSLKAERFATLSAPGPRKRKANQGSKEASLVNAGP